MGARINKGAVAGLVVLVAASAAAETPDEAIALVPGDAEAAVVVPNLKKASDDLMLCIERTERNEALLGGRPLDLFKARLGLSVGLRDEGALVAVLRRGADGADEPRALLLVPVNNAQEFLEGNFKPTPENDGSLLPASGGRLFAKAIGRHVALAPTAAGLDGIGPDPLPAIGLRERLGVRAARMIDRGDLFLWASGDAARRGLARAEIEVQRAGEQAAPALAGIEASRRWANGLADAIISVDFDALGIMPRGVATSVAESELSGLLGGGSPTAAATLSRLPRNPFYLAVAMDIAGLGGWAVLDRLRALGAAIDWLPAWMRGADAIQFGVYPSKLGVAVGGVLNDSALVLLSADPESLRNGFRDTLLASAGETAGVRIEPAWEDDKSLKGGDKVDAFEVKDTPLPGAKDSNAAAAGRLVRSILLGNRGFHGFARTVPGALVVTFSQRPDVLGRATDAAVGGDALANDEVVRAMHDFMLARPDVEAYIGVGQLGRLLKQVAQLVPGGADAMLPEIDVATEPIGYALEVSDGSIEAASVMPASVVGLFIDAARRRIMQP
ncbi:MAG: hypothetical protein KDA22_03255 [Phycisphaerales bacterium]|nr:hypothetical protein [Phycisphaerales bacterium]